MNWIEELKTQRGRAEAMIVTIRGPILPVEVDGLCDGLRQALDGCDAELVVCDLAGVDHPDAATVELLARLALTSRRLGRSMCLRDPPPWLLELIALMGLADVHGLALQAERHPEQREEVLRVQEEGDAGDPVA